jgi:hypothetical protein
MAVIYNAQGKKKDVASQPTEQPLAPSAPAAGGATPQATAAPKPAGSGFTDLGTYLKANKTGIEKTATNLANKAVSGVDTSIKGPEVTKIENTTVDLAGDTSGAVADLGKKYEQDAYQKQLDAEAAGKLQSAGQQLGAASRLAAGDMSQALSGIGGGARQGLRNLTAFGVNRDPNAQKTFQGAVQKAQANTDTLATNTKAAAARIAEGKTAFDARRKELLGNIEKAQGQELAREAGRVSTQLETPALTGHKLDTNTLASLITPPTSSYTIGGRNSNIKGLDSLNADISKLADDYYRQHGQKYNKTGSSIQVRGRSGEEQQRMDALNRLLTAGNIEQKSFDDASLIRESGKVGSEGSFDTEGFKQGLRDYLAKQISFRPDVDMKGGRVEVRTDMPASPNTNTSTSTDAQPVPIDILTGQPIVSAPAPVPVPASQPSSSTTRETTAPISTNRTVSPPSAPKTSGNKTTTTKKKTTTNNRKI